MSDHRSIIPSARRLMNSLRDIGYDAPAAIADLVDNSIDADARHISVTIAQEGGRSWVRVADDGIGMTPRELDEAMRYGSRRDYDAHHLGHFGLGLKTASLSQCRRLTVAARTTPTGRIEARRWDLDSVAQRDAWDLERITPRQCPPALVNPLRVSPGTVVLWERLDRVLAYARPDGASAMRALRQLVEDVERHLAMVFHRFLSGQLGRGRTRLKIIVNERALAPWDPFARGEPATERLETQWVRMHHAGRTHRVRIQPYVLPPQIRFSSPDAHLSAGGPKRWNRQQGLYIYRRDRMIQSGGWNRLRTLDEHSKLARLAVDIPPGAETAFQISVSKMSVVLPADLRAALGPVVSGVVTRAQDAYRQRIRLVSSSDRRLDAEAVPAPDEDAPWKMSERWEAIVAVLHRELADQPEVLRRVLVSLANVQAPVGVRSIGESR
jgi:hypothetical protein